MVHDPAHLPVIPFTEAETTAMRSEDVKAAKSIATLATGIFLLGVVLYLFVLFWTILSTPNYATR